MPRTASHSRPNAPRNPAPAHARPPRVPGAFVPGAAACRLPGAIEFTGLGRTTLLGHVKAGRLRARKAGRALVFEVDSLRDLVASLPLAGGGGG